MAEPSEFEVLPIPGKNYEGRQWGYEIVKGGETLFEVTTGGTGTCWNIDSDPGDLDATPLHVCDLDEAIAALRALRDSEAHRLHVERWS